MKEIYEKCIFGTALNSKLDASGNFLWAKNMGGLNSDGGSSIAVDASGNIYTTGFFAGTADFDPDAETFNLASAGGSWDIFVLKLGPCKVFAPPVCLVTVDSFSQNNMIIWDKTQTNQGETIFIYRDTANNAYGLIGQVPYDSLSQFIDTMRTIYAANGDPNASSWKYKIDVMDSCGINSAKSPFHQSLFIQNILGNFSWNHYQIEGQPTPVPGLTNYLFQRDDSSTGNWQTIQTLSASSTAYTDPQFSNFLNSSYRIKTQWNTQCSATKSSVDYNSSHSNVKGIAAPGSVKELSLENVISIYPNPNDGTFTIEFLTSDFHLPASITVYNVLGEIVYQKPLTTYSAPIILKQPAGIYNIQIVTIQGVANKKLVVEKQEGQR